MKKRFFDPNQLDVFGQPKRWEKEKQKNVKQEGKKVSLVQLKKHAGELGISLTKGIKDGSPIYYVKDSWITPNKFEARLYLLDITIKCLRGNSLVILPTGLGKTYIAILLMAFFLKRQLNKKILFLAPTKPLSSIQHLKKIINLLPNIKVGILTGKIAKNKRLSIWKNNSIIIATPQTIVEELKKNSGVGNVNDIQRLFIDEVHHLTGDYAYSHIVKNYQKNNPNIHIIGFTASIDSDIQKLEALRKHIKVLNRQVLASTYDSPDVKPYCYNRNIKPLFRERKMSDIQKSLKGLMVYQLTEIVERIKIGLRMLNIKPDTPLIDCIYKNENDQVAGIKIRKFNNFLENLKKIVKQGNTQPEHFTLLANWGLTMRFNIAINMLNKGLSEFSHFLQRQYISYNKDQKNPKPSQKSFVYNEDIKSAVIILYKNQLWPGKLPNQIDIYDIEYDQSKFKWPLALEDEKLKTIKQIISGCLKSQILIFTSYRDTLRKVEYFINQEFPNLTTGRLTGTSAKYNNPGMSQKEQQEVLEKYGTGEIRILISTSIGEEGLDYPAVDVLIFYEPIPDVRRYIQRLGRTARHRIGTVFILIYENTEEMTIHYSCRAREKKVQKIIDFYQKFQ